MAKDPKKRQKQLERRKAKQKEKQSALARQKSLGFAASLARPTDLPLRHCCRSQELWDDGIGYVLLSRNLADGRIAVVAFLLDVYCLGVKDALTKLTTPDDYEHMRRSLAGATPFIDLEPSCARKLVESAVEYARGLGLPPHPDYRKGHAIFGEIDATACDEEFSFGKEGKPFFVSGPHDSRAKCRRIVNTLHQTCGEGGYDYMIAVGPDLGAGWDEPVFEDFDEPESIEGDERNRLEDQQRED